MPGSQGLKLLALLVANYQAAPAALNFYCPLRLPGASVIKTTTSCFQQLSSSRICLSDDLVESSELRRQLSALTTLAQEAKQRARPFASFGLCQKKWRGSSKKELKKIYDEQIGGMAMPMIKFFYKDVDSLLKTLED